MTSSSKAIALCALIVLICIGALSFWSEIRSENDREWVTHSHLVVEKLQSVRIAITGAESAQRGYLLTGQDLYLQLYGTSVDKLGRETTAVRELASDPGQQEAIQRLEPLLAGRVTELASGIALRRQSGPSAAVEAMAREKNHEEWMALIATQINGMRRAESQLLSRRLDLATASTQRVKVTIVCGSALAILILLVTGHRIHAESVTRNLAEQNLERSNDRLERRTAELSEANIELESFAYSIAHDLRAPLRHIAGYSSLLVQDYASHLDHEGLRRLTKIVDGADQMGRLVDDLLSLSQIGQQNLSTEDTPLGALLAEAIEDLAPEYSGREVTWRIGDLSSAECDPGLMKQVFVNLLSNAVKYTRTREHAVIEVGQANENGEQVVFVRDNGVGFEMKYAGKLFGVFQRLHKARDFEGTGVGLAIVQRIIRKHGGRIWAEAEINQGATFFFTVGPSRINTTQETKVSIVEDKAHVA